MELTYSELHSAIMTEKLNIRPDCMRGYKKISGDINALEYGSIFCRYDTGTFYVSVLHGRDNDEYAKRKNYIVTEYIIDLIDLVSAWSDYAPDCDIWREDYIDNPSIGIYNMLDAAIFWGVGHNGAVLGRNAKELLGFNPENRTMMPSVFCQIED